VMAHGGCASERASSAAAAAAAQDEWARARAVGQ
jgi:hypothetical protein